MALDLSQLKIKKVVFHEIPRHYTGDKPKPIFSEIESELDDDLRKFLRERMVSTIGGDKAFEIVFSKVSDSPIKGILGEIWKDEETLVEKSKLIATYLNKIQSGRSPGGLVAILLGSQKVGTGQKTFTGIFKLEKEEGARIEQSKVSGKKTFNLKHFKDLIFTAKTKVFKVGGFLEGGLKDCDGIICDNQLSPTSPSGVAAFFLTDFLGCELLGDPKVQTKNFFEATQAFINMKVNDGALKSEYAVHLSSYLLSQGKYVEPKHFASQYLQAQHRQPFENYLKSADINTSRSLKDNQFIENKLKKTILEFDNGVKISGPAEKMKEGVHLKDMSDGTTEARVRSKMKKVRS